MKCTNCGAEMVYSFLLGNKIEWEQQLNSYAWLARQRDITITELQIVAILRDHVVSKSLREADYPNSPILIKTIPLWSPEKMEKYIQDRVQAHLLREGRPIPCTPAERYHKDDSFAVKVPNVQKAKRVLATEAEAHEWARKNIKGSYEVEKRKGDDSRCKIYCSVRNFCEDNPYRGQEVEDGGD